MSLSLSLSGVVDLFCRMDDNKEEIAPNKEIQLPKRLI